MSAPLRAFLSRLDQIENWVRMALSRSAGSSSGPFVPVTEFGAKADARIVRDASIAAAAVHSATANFTATDVGKSFLFPNAGVAGAPLFGTITGVSSPSNATVAPPASTPIAAGGTFSWGTDNGPAVQAAVNGIPVGETAYFPPPEPPFVGYFFSTGVSLPVGARVAGGISGSIGGALLIVALQQGGPFGTTNCLFSKLPVFGAQFSLAAPAAIGQTIVQVTGGDFVKGQEILISEDAFRASSYHVVGADLLNPQHVTLDRPLLQAWTTADFATHWSGMAEDIAVSEVTITGTALRALEIEGQNNTLARVLFSDTVCMVWETGCSFDTAGYANLYDNVQSDGNGEGYRVEGNELTTVRRGRNRGRNQETAIAQIGILLADCVSCPVIDTETSNYQIGVQLDTGGPDPLEKCVGCSLVNVVADGCVTGIFVDQADGTGISNSSCVGNTTGLLCSVNSNTTVASDSRFNSNPGVNGVGIQIDARATLDGSNIETSFNGETGLNVFGTARIANLKIAGGNGVQSVNLGNQGGGSPDPIAEITGFDITQDGPASIFIMTAGRLTLRSGASHQTNAVPFANHINVAAGVVKVDDCSFDGTGSVNWLALAAGATGRWSNVDTALPDSIAAGAFTNIGSVQLNGAVPVVVPWPDLQVTERVFLGALTTAPTAGGLAAAAAVLQTVTPGTGFTLVSVAGNNGVYPFEIR